MQSPTVYDLVIRNALILDGTGAPGRPGDLAVEGGTIARIEGRRHDFGRTGANGN